MAHNIYDKNGRKVGEIKSEEEAFNDGCLTVAIVIFVLFVLPVIVGIYLFGRKMLELVFGAWPLMLEKLFSEGEIFPLFIMIPIIITTFVVWKFTTAKGIKSGWSMLWRITLADTVVGFIFGMLYFLWAEFIDGTTSFDWYEAVAGVIMLSFGGAVLPAVILALCSSKRKKQESKVSNPVSTDPLDEYIY